jgi:hypothetical protein
MATIESTVPAQRLGTSTTELRAPHSERSAAGSRPVARWVQMPGADGRNRLTMVWAVPDRLPSRNSA